MTLRSGSQQSQVSMEVSIDKRNGRHSGRAMEAISVPFTCVEFSGYTLYDNDRACCGSATMIHSISASK